jgi:hypothetical protein
MQSPVCGIFPEQGRQDRLDQRKATHPIGKRRIRRDLECDRAAIGMTDEMKRSFRRAQGFAEMGDFIRERRRQDRRSERAAIAGNIGRDHLIMGSKRLSQFSPLTARTERAMQGYDTALLISFFKS